MRTDVIVVGAGPAGLAAAASARQEGLEVVVVDERNKAGGRRACGAIGQLPADAAWWLPPLGDDRERARIDRLSREAAEAEFVFGALAWGLFAGPTLAVTRSGRTMRIDADQVILATGSYVARPPIEGHELDSVLTPAGVTCALDAHELGPEASIAVLGEGALADGVIDELRRRKVLSITRLVERPTPSEVPVRVLAAPPELREAGGRVKVDVVLAGGESDSLSVDALVVADAQVPASELAAMIGCRHRFAGYRRGFVPIHGVDGSTTVEGVFVAGALTGTVEAEHAERSGRIAGLAAAVRAGRGAAEALRAAIADAPDEKPIPETVPREIEGIDPGSAA
ncbi:MAG: FAD-dependent oxidoreductase, partial [Gemmatimonadota bacterium]